MNLASLIPINKPSIRESEEESLLLDYSRKFSEKYGLQPLFKYMGVKDNVQVYEAELTDLGDLSLVFTEANIVATVSKKQAMFGIVYTMSGLARLDATICKMKRTEKDGYATIELIEYDRDDTKNFKAEDTKFKNIIK